MASGAWQKIGEIETMDPRSATMHGGKPEPRYKVYEEKAKREAMGVKRPKSEG